MNTHIPPCVPKHCPCSPGVSRKQMVFSVPSTSTSTLYAPMAYDNSSSDSNSISISTGTAHSIPLQQHSPPTRTPPSPPDTPSPRLPYPSPRSLSTPPPLSHFWRLTCVMPPASPAATFALRIKSSRLVLPWSTWPITVTTGGRGSCMVVEGERWWVVGGGCGGTDRGEDKEEGVGGSGRGVCVCVCRCV